MNTAEIESKKKTISEMSQRLFDLVSSGKREAAREIFMEIKKAEHELSQMILDSKPWRDSQWQQ